MPADQARWLHQGAARGHHGRCQGFQTTWIRQVGSLQNTLAPCTVPYMCVDLSGRYWNASSAAHSPALAQHLILGGMCRMHYQQKSGKQTLAGIYFVPVSPQLTRIVTKFLFKTKEGSGNIGGAVFGTLAKVAEQTGLLHVLGAGLVDQVCSLFLQYRLHVAPDAAPYVCEPCSTACCCGTGALQ